MKTLDEVIKVFSEVNKEVGCGDCQFNDAESDDIPCEMTDCIFADALHYLKMYRSDQIQWEADRKLWTDKQEQVVEARQKYIDKLKELEIGTLNDPLTWDELKGMEGKPVWIEYFRRGSCFDSEWVILKDINDSCMSDTEHFGYDADGYGKTWQAYRKERK